MKLITASAGSGKTYRIAKEFVKYVLKSPLETNEILAVTFTNKAAAEMKERVMLFLKVLSGHSELLDDKSRKTLSGLQEEVLNELVREDPSWTANDVNANAEKALNNILYSGTGGGYSDFSVMTIDAFTARMTKVFAFELDIQHDISIGMNMNNIIRNSVDKLISMADPATVEGMDITRILLNNILYQIDQNKGLMIEDEINDLTVNLRKLEKSFGENISIPNEYTEDLDTALEKLNTEIGTFENYVRNICNSMIERVKTMHQSSCIPHDMYKGKSRGFLSYAEKCCNDVNPETITSLLTKKAYLDVLENGISSLTGSKKAEWKGIDNAEESLNRVIETARQLDAYIRLHIAHYITNIIVRRRIYSNLLYERVNELIGQYQKENEILFIDELNDKISGLFDDNNEVPFIYFRMGERFKKYMVDEFQDTSMVQWKNMKPLIENALAEEEFSMAVGDLKQAIYRFRGGSTDVMIRELKEKGADKEILESNWRSKPNIIALNNNIFSNLLSDKNILEDIYDKENVRQRYKEDDYPTFSNDADAGYCEINLMKKDADLKDYMIEKGNLITIIKDILSRGYRQSSICILVRTNHEGNEIAELLSSDRNDIENLKIMSADTLFIKDNPFVNFIIYLLKYALDENDNEAFIHIVHLWKDIAGSGSFEAAQKAIFNEMLIGRKKIENFSRKEKGIILSLLWGEKAYRNYVERIRETINTVSVYESISLIMEFIINPLCSDYSSSIAHIAKLRNTAFSRMKEENTYNFLKYYDEYSDELHIPAPSSENAVTISTVHKAKGLQYDVVIIPFAKWNEARNMSKGYFILEEPEIAVKYGDIKNEYTEFCVKYAADRKKQAGEESLFDDVNLLYVAMTRACDELYIYTNEREKYEELDTVEKLLNSRFNELKDMEVNTIENDELIKMSIGQKAIINTAIEEQEIASRKLIANSHKDHLFIDRKTSYILHKNSEKNAAAARGILIHNVLAGIKNGADVEKIINSLIKTGEINNDEAANLRDEVNDIMECEEFKCIFNDDYKVLNERDIIFSSENSAEIIRPDRVMIKDREAVIVDYKTGSMEDEHSKQLKKYLKAYAEMGYSVKGFIAYTADRRLVEVEK